MAEEDCVYEVDQVLGRRILQGKCEYLIRWKNFDSSWDTWEPVENLGQALDSIRQYNQHNKPLNSSQKTFPSQTKPSTLFSSSKSPLKNMAAGKLVFAKKQGGVKLKKKPVKLKKTGLTSKRDKNNNVKGLKSANSNKYQSKGRKKTKRETCACESDSDDGILYSLNPDFQAQVSSEQPNQLSKSQKDAGKGKGKEKKYRMTWSEKKKKMNTPRTLRSGKTVSTKPVKLDLTPRKRPSTEVSVDSEISFQSVDSPKRYRFSNFHLPTTIVRPVARLPQTPLTSDRIPSPLHSSFRTPPRSPRPTSPISPRFTRSRSVTPSADLMASLSSPSKFSVVPTSPTTVSYQTLISDLPRKLLANRHVTRRSKRKGGGDGSSDGSDDDVSEGNRRLSIRQSESSFKYKEIVVKKFKWYTQIWLFTNTQMRNALNPNVFRELISALNNAKYDDSKLVMLSGSGNTFCSGIDLNYLTTGDRKATAVEVANSLREFMNTILSFPKPIVAAVNGPAIGLGVAILPLCDIVYASDKASFYMPYARLAQTPEGCASLTLGLVVGQAMAAEMLLGGRKLTAIEAYQVGLVSQVFWPTSMMQEVIPRVCNMASFSAKALEATKLLIRGHQKSKLEYTNESECNLLIDMWAAPECHKAIQNYLEDENDILF